MRSFSSHPLISATLKLDSNLSLFKCAPLIHCRWSMFKLFACRKWNSTAKILKVNVQCIVFITRLSLEKKFNCKLDWKKLIKYWASRSKRWLVKSCKASVHCVPPSFTTYLDGIFACIQFFSYLLLVSKLVESLGWAIDICCAVCVVWSLCDRSAGVNFSPLSWHILYLWHHADVFCLSSNLCKAPKSWCFCPTGGITYQCLLIFEKSLPCVAIWNK